MYFIALVQNLTRRGKRRKVHGARNKKKAEDFRHQASGKDKTSTRGMALIWNAVIFQHNPNSNT